MNTIKAIVLDIDGTLARKDNTIDPLTQAALLKAQAQGVRLFLASGRPTTGLQDYSKALDLEHNDGYLISYNGGKVSHAADGKILYNKPMNPERRRELFKHLRNFDITTMVDDGQTLYATHEHGINVQEEAGWCHLDVQEVSILEDVVDFDTNKVLISGDPQYLIETYHEIQEPFLEDHACVFSAPFYFEIMPKGIDKGETLRATMEMLAIDPEHVMVFGDGHNDKEMIEYAGVGVAMGNAVQAVKDVADYVTLSNEENGIVEALRLYRVI